MKTALTISLVFIGCCSNVVTLELLVRNLPGCGNIITFSQFLFIATKGFICEADFGRKEPVIPIRNYGFLVCMFFSVGVLNNYCLNFNISMPLHMIIKSGSLIANMIMGIIILKKRYTFTKYLSIALVSLGIFICTIMSAKQVNVANEGSEEKSFEALMRWFLGVAMLTSALLISARMGIFQETLFQKYGKVSKEALFYCHCLPLPGFLLLSKDIYNQAVDFNQSALLFIPGIPLSMPTIWVYLIINIITQYICVSSVFTLTTECPSLTVTLVLTLRKFLSLIFSILYFQNPFTTLHWVGTAVVFLGTLLYAEVLQLPGGRMWGTFVDPDPPDTEASTS